MASNKTSYSNYLLFLLSPMIALWVSIINFKSKSSKNILWFFVTFYAVTFVIPSEESDAFRYKIRYEALSKSQISLIDFSKYIYSTDHLPETGKKYKDVMQPMLSFLGSRISKNYQLLYLFVGLIFGYFYSRNIWLLFELVNSKSNTSGFFLIFVFSLIIPFWTLTSIRMWTAAHLFFYGGMNFLLKGNKKWIGIAALSTLVHFSFMLPVFVLFIYIVLGNRINTYFTFFIIMFLVNEIDLVFLRSILETASPQSFHDVIKVYTPETITQVTEKKISWHASSYLASLKWVYMSLISLIFFRGKKFWTTNIKFKNIFSFSLFFLGVGQLFSLVPSSGGRYLLVAFLFATVSLFFYLHFNRDAFFKKIYFLLTPLLFFFCIVSIRVGFDSISLDIFNSPIISLFYNLEVPLIDFIK